uniref:Uncharacterized protein n=1 Tax=Fagus sylvatica TaxID=28930 RepID=A0A2N9HQP4_FAGSY
MVAGGSDWPAELLEELLEGFSSLRRESEEALSEATISTRVVSRLPVESKLWVFYSYFSKFNAESISRIRSRYPVPEDVVLRIPDLDERACSHVEDVAPNGWRVIISSMVMWKESSDGLDDITVEEFLYCFEPRLPLSNRGWKDGYLFVCGDNWERLHEEGDDFIQIRRTWGTPSSAALTRPTLTSIWKDRILRPPSIVQIPDEEIAVVQATDDGSTICRSPGLTAKRAVAAIIELDFQEYANARTENISKLMSLNEAMVISHRCISVEDDLVRLKQRLAESEASQKSLNRAVFELNKEKRDLLGAVEAVKAFRKQAKEKYPNIDFTEFQLYDDTDSVNDGGEKVNDADQADDATT